MGKYDEYAVVCEHVDKTFKLDNVKKHRFAKKKIFYALKDINFKVVKGDVVGILGTNGSGKSTLSNLLAGISEPNGGKLFVNGKQELIAIKAGMEPQLTGLENIKVKGALLGLSKKRIEEITQGVIEFAELGDFFYQPVKKYSSGMRARLGFSISICLDPDILIVDEALSVGDKAFASKCMDKMNELKDNGKTVFFISHSLNQMRDFCSSAIWIEAGKLKAQGEVNQLCDEYEEFTEQIKKMSKKENLAYKQKVFESRIEK